MRPAVCKFCTPQFKHRLTLTIFLRASAVFPARLAAVPEWRVNSARPPVEECVSRARDEAACEQWRGALTWIRRARAQSPTTTRLAYDEAWTLANLGDVDGAIDILHSEYECATNGEAAYLASRIIMRSTHDAERAAQWLMRAVDRSPWMIAAAHHDHEMSGVLATLTADARARA